MLLAVTIIVLLTAWQSCSECVIWLRRRPSNQSVHKLHVTAQAKHQGRGGNTCLRCYFYVALCVSYVMFDTCSLSPPEIFVRSACVSVVMASWRHGIHAVRWNLSFLGRNANIASYYLFIFLFKEAKSIICQFFIFWIAVGDFCPLPPFFIKKKKTKQSDVCPSKLWSPLSQSQPYNAITLIVLSTEKMTTKRGETGHLWSKLAIDIDTDCSLHTHESDFMTNPTPAKTVMPSYHTHETPKTIMLIYGAITMYGSRAE